MQNKKTVKKPVVKSKSKVVAGGKRQLRPLWQRVTAAVLAFVLLGSIGSFGYYKWKERDITAKAAAFQLRPQDYLEGKLPANGVRMAVCRKGFSIIGIVTHPPTERWQHPDGKYYNRWATIYKSGSAATDVPEKASRYNEYWFGYNPYITFVQIGATNKDWVWLSFVNNGGPNPELHIYSKRILAAFIPDC